MKQYDLLHKAVRELAVRCDGAQDRDGQGFNKPDSYQGKFLAQIPVDQWTQDMAAAAYWMIEKYREQLLEYGIDLDDVPQPNGLYEHAPLVNKQVIDFDEKRRLFVLDYDFSRVLNEHVKKIPGWAFDGRQKYWTVPVTSHEEVMRFAVEHAFFYTARAQEALDNIEEMASEAAAVEQERREKAQALTISWDDEASRFNIYFPKEDASLRQVIKDTVPNRSFNSAASCWQAPHDAGAALAELAEAFPFDVTDDAREKMATAPSPHRVDLAGDWFLVYFPYDDEMKRSVKAITGRKFTKKPQPHWQVPVASAIALSRFLAQYDAFDVKPHAKQALDEALSRQAQNMVESRAADADVEVNGLQGDLRPFQRAGVAYAIRNRRVFIADEMGLGKTIQALATIQALHAYPALIIVPASLKLNWAREAAKWLPEDKTVEVISAGSDPAFRGDVIIINYDILADGWKSKKDRTVVLSRYAAPLRRLGLRSIVLDESHYVKSRDAQRSAACRDLAKDVDVRLLLTGTPVLNRPEELINQLRVLGHLKAMGGFWQFATRYCEAQQTRFGLDTSGASNLDELNEKLRALCFIRRLKADVLKELPPKQRNEVIVDIDNRPEYDEARDNLIGWLRRRAVEEEAFLESIADLPPKKQKEAKWRRAGNAQVKASRAEELVRINALKRLVAQGKMTAVAEWVENFLASGEKLVLFAHHVDVVKELAQRFDAPTIMGETSQEDRQAAVDAFQNDDDCRLIVGNLEAMGVGLTLTAASNVAFVELGWTPAVHDQAEDRVHRIGQEGQSVSAWYLLAEDTIDEEIYRLIDKKRLVVDAATEGGTIEDGSVLASLLETLQDDD